MASTFILQEAEEGFSDRIDFFNVQPVDTSITEVYIQEFEPINPLSDRSNITFDISNQTGEYIDLKNARLITTLIIRGEDGKPIKEVDDVTLINMPCISCYSQMDVKLQKTEISTGVGDNLAYKGMIDTLLGYGLNDHLSWFALGGFYKDTATVMEDHVSKGSANSGLVARNKLTKEGSEVRLISPFICDIAEQSKLLINGVNLTVKLYPASEDFRLLYAPLTAMAPDTENVSVENDDYDDYDDEDDDDDDYTEADGNDGHTTTPSPPLSSVIGTVKRKKKKPSKKGKNKKRKTINKKNSIKDGLITVADPPPRTSKRYRVSIKNVVLSLPFVKINNAALEVISKRLESDMAIYTFMKSEIIAFNIGVGSWRWSTNQIFQDSIPDRVVIGLVAGKAYSGDHTKNPFNFQAFGLKKISFSVNGKSVPGPPLEIDFSKDDYSQAYSTIFESSPPWQKEAPALEYGDFKDGYALYVFDIEKHRSRDFMTPMKTGNTRLELIFSEKTTESINVIVYGKVPSVFKVDSARNVYLENQA